MVVGVGVDLVQIARIRRAMERWQDRFLERVFTAGELAYARRRRDPAEHLAARFAAKEALLKALTSGLTGAMRWHDIEVARDPAGTPRLVVTGATREALDRHGLLPCSVSLSHTKSHAVAVVLLASS